MAGMRETQLTADVELLSSTVETSKNKQQTRPPISMNFEVCSTNYLAIPNLHCSHLRHELIQ